MEVKISDVQLQGVHWNVYKNDIYNDQMLNLVFFTSKYI